MSSSTNIERSDVTSEGHNTSENQSYVDDDYMIEISNALPSLQQCYDFVAADPSCGAVSTFIGITRNSFQLKEVLSLSYEAYVPMAMKELLKLCTECKQISYQSIRRIAAVHIIGDCPVGHASVILACSSPHRLDAIQCCEYLINQLKARIPIWKKEIYVNEPNAIWKENIEWFQHQQHPKQGPTECEASETTDTTKPPPETTELQSRRVMVRQPDV